MFSKIVLICICLDIGSCLRFFRNNENLENLDSDFKIGSHQKVTDSADSDSAFVVGSLDQKDDVDSYPDFNIGRRNHTHNLFFSKQAACGYTAIPPHSMKIMGGEDATPYSWPWQVSVQLRYDNGDLVYFCGGFIISSYKVITAAHCLYDDNGSLKPIANLHVVAGIFKISESFDSDAQSRKVIRFAISSGYVYSTLKKGVSPNDIAILYVDKAFNFGVRVQPACLPTSQVPENTACYATGWGMLWKGQQHVQGTLRQVKVQIVGNPTCAQMYAHGTIISSMICAGGGGKDSCPGDSGGPLACYRGGRWVVDGIVSFGTGCGTSGEPGVYTRVFDFLKLINSS